MAIEAALAHAGIVEPRDMMLPCVLPRVLGGGSETALPQ
jgi:hypothetical protein